MPQIPKEAMPKASQFIKPTKLNVKVGDTRVFTITGPHQTGQQGLLSLPVKVMPEGLEGLFPLNKTHTALLVSLLGEDSDKWVNRSFEATVVFQNNPKLGRPTMSWSITGLKE